MHETKDHSEIYHFMCRLSKFDKVITKKTPRKVSPDEAKSPDVNKKVRISPSFDRSARVTEQPDQPNCSQMGVVVKRAQTSQSDFS